MKTSSKEWRMAQVGKAANDRVTERPEKARSNSRFKSLMKETWEAGKLVARHPFITAAIVSTALVAFSQNEARAQEKPVPVVNMAKQTYKTSLKDGYLTFEGLGVLDVKKLVKMITGNENASEKDVRIKTNVELDGTGGGVYYVFDRGILGIFVNKDGNAVTCGVGTDGDTLFMHQGAIFLADNGAIFATSPTVLVWIIPKGVANAKYSEDFGDVPKLTRPMFSKGKDAGYVEMRDPALGKLKMKISTTEAKYQVVEDEQLLGAVGSR